MPAQEQGLMGVTRSFLASGGTRPASIHMLVGVSGHLSIPLVIDSPGVTLHEEVPGRGEPGPRLPWAVDRPGRGAVSPGQGCGARASGAPTEPALWEEVTQTRPSVLWTPRLCDQQPHELPGALGGDLAGDPGLRVPSTQVAGQALGRVLPTYGSI